MPECATKGMSLGYGRKRLQTWPAGLVQVAQRGMPIAEVNLDTSGATDICQYVLQVALICNVLHAAQFLSSIHSC